jgi:hypothetical protein
MNETLEIPIGTEAPKPTVGGWLLAITQTLQEDQQQIPTNEMTERERRFFLTICVLSEIVERFNQTAPREVTTRVMGQPLIVNLTPRGQ